MTTLDAEIGRAVSALKAGELVAFPTETVYGLGADARNADAVRRIYTLKGRPPGHPLIVHLASGAELGAWARSVPQAARRLAERFWPGPLTLILPRAAGVLDELTGGQPTIALRVPSHPLAHRLLAAFGDGIAAPSANRYGRVSPTTAAHVREEFGAALPIVLDGGASSVGLESTIVSCLDELLLLRPGGITVPELEALVGPVRRADRGEGPRAPGSPAAHYAPGTPLVLAAGAAFAAAALAPAAAVLAQGPARAGFSGRLWIDAGRNAVQYGHDLYSNLRRLDHSGAGTIVVESPPEGPAWEAIRDRLTRAAAACGAEEIA
ncbi:MAG TPA: L-threonylcarbamoyladenylate synthase [Steroidobacteraceae bacterium]|nr:L-threonylcarbamoyladenylate synthase [Steroidobacteraceae bacterium]